MNIVKYKLNLFDVEPTFTEKNVLGLLEEKPIQADVTYFAASWNSIINKDIINTIEHDKMRGKVFTVCDHILFEKALDKMASIGINTLFISHLSTVTKSSKVVLKPFPQWPMRTGLPGEKTILYSFIGFVSHPLRRNLLNMKHPSGCVIKERPNWYFWDKTHDVGNQYIETLQRSRFSLCPVGSGPSTIRFWESLVAGAIPILISDEIALPDYDWDGCIIRVPENQLSDIPNIVSSISTDHEEKLRVRCLQAADQFTGNNFVSVIRKYYASY
jgi:hypothetical protein